MEIQGRTPSDTSFPRVPTQARARSRRSWRPQLGRARDYLFALAAVAAAVSVAALIEPMLPLANLSLVFMTAVLLVAVRTSAWLMELRLMEREILRNLNQGRSRGQIQKIRFLMADEPGPLP